MTIPYLKCRSFFGILFLIFILSFLFVPSHSYAAATYNFETDTIGQVPANTTVTAGTFDVQNEPTLGNSLRAVTQTGVIAGILFDNFAGSADQSVIWKQAYSNNLGRGGFTLRAQAIDTSVVNSAGARMGYLFHVYDSSNVYIWRVSSGTYTPLWSGSLPKSQPRWFKATAIGTSLSFYYSDDGVTYTLLGSATDATYPSGLVQYTAGYGAAVDRDYVDEIVITDLDAPATEFITTWKTDNPGVSSSNQITIPTTNGLTYNYNVDWGDSNTDTGVTGAITHTYVTPGTYTVSISGVFPAITFAYAGDKNKILSVDQWGTIAWENMAGAFFGCTNLAITATDAPDLSGVTDMTYMLRDSGVTTEDLSGWDTGSIISMIGVFQGTAFNGDISSWDTSNVTNMIGLFYADAAFNQPLNSWDVSHVTRFDSMFTGAAAFNQPLNNWDVSSATSFDGMFMGASVFNQNISNWNTANVTNMSSMFMSTNAFNQPLNSWDVSHVTGMGGMFYEANAFNQPLNNWDTSSVIGMGTLFMGAELFNQPLDNWDVSHVTYFGNAFQGTSFNQDISGWDVSAATDMYAMFAYDTHFNQDISSWDTSNVTNMDSMFYLTTDFDQNLSSWDVADVTNMVDMFTGVTLSRTNYDAMLSSWASQNLRSNVSFDGGQSKYCLASASRARLMGVYNWSVIDGGVVSGCVGIAAQANTTNGGGVPVQFVSSQTPSVGTLTTLQPATITSLNTQPSAAKFVFTQTLKLGSGSEEVLQLQKYLNTHGFPIATSGMGSAGNEVTTFGAKTAAALIKFQKANKIAPAIGYFGPLTRSFVNSH